jgi:hypothetical protein
LVGNHTLIQEEILRKSSTSINAGLQKQNPNARLVKTIEDFSYVKDS